MPPPSPPPDADSRLAMPAGSHPMHGLIHPSRFAQAAFIQAERDRRAQFPNPCAIEQWDEWHRQHQHDRSQAALPSPAGSWPSEFGSRRGSADSNWSAGSQARQDQRELDLPPLPWPPAFNPSGTLVGAPAAGPNPSVGGDAASAAHDAGQARTTWSYPLPPNLPLPTVREDPLADPDENTVFYGAAYEYYSGSNLNTINSSDFVPWDVKRQTQRERGRGSGFQETHTWLGGRGSRRHMVVFTKSSTKSDPDEFGEQGGGDED